MPLFTDLIECKSLLDIHPDDRSEDKKILFLIEMATDWITELLGRPGFFYQVRTEYYDGPGSQKLLLNSRPVHAAPTIQVVTDESGFFGSSSGSFGAQATTLTYGTDFCLALDTDMDGDGVQEASRRGLLVRMNDYWPRPQVRQIGLLTPFLGEGHGNIRVTYAGGYTFDQLPSQLRLACIFLVARMRYMLPLGMEIAGENYQERSVSIVGNQKVYLLTPVRPFILSYRNWTWGGG